MQDYKGINGVHAAMFRSLIGILIFACFSITMVTAAVGRDAAQSWTIHREPEFFRAIDPSLCRLASGELLLAFSGNRDAQVCPWGAIKLIRSADDGKTWSKPTIVFDGILDDRAPILKAGADGTITLTFVTSTAFRNLNVAYRRHYGKIPHDAVRKNLGTFRVCSTDGGRTWSSPERIADRSADEANATSCTLGDGKILSVSLRPEKPLGRPVLTATKEAKK